MTSNGQGPPAGISPNGVWRSPRAFWFVSRVSQGHLVKELVRQSSFRKMSLCEGIHNNFCSFA